MLLNQIDFQKLIKEIPSIEVSLEWDGNEGRTKLEGHEVETSSFFLVIGLSIFESGTTDSGDYFTPPSFSSNGVNSEINSLKVYKNESEEEIKFTEEQDSLLYKEIISLISTTN